MGGAGYLAWRIGKRFTAAVLAYAVTSPTILSASSLRFPVPATRLPGLAQGVFEALPDEIFLSDFEPPPSNDKCETAATLVVGTATQGTTHDATPDYSLDSCTIGTQAGADVAYSVLLVSGQSYTVTVTPEASFDASIALLGPGTASVCNAMPVTCLESADVGFDGFPETFQFTPSQTGTYYIIVDSFYSSGISGSGSFSLEVKTP